MNTDGLTREQILTMESGRELDRLIGEHIFSYKNILNVADYWFIDDLNTSLPYYSTDISAAFEVVEKIKGRRICIEKTLSGSFYCVIGHSDDGHKPADYQAQTATEAICKAALLAVMDG